VVASMILVAYIFMFDIIIIRVGRWMWCKVL
jgi:hypothetical protein